MASSNKPKEEKKKKKSNGTPTNATKKPTKKPEKKASTTKKPNKSKPKTGSKLDKNKNSNGTLVESEVSAQPSSSTESKGEENENKTNKSAKLNTKKQKEKVEENEEEEEEEEDVTKMCRFPMNRIKRIIKSEDSRMAVPQDVVFLVNKATEKFLQQFCEDGYKCSVKDRKKSLSYKHLSTVVHEQRRYDFLSDYVPEKIKAEDALKERNSTETGAG